MRLRIGPPPDSTDFSPQKGGWSKLKEPSFNVFMLFALPASVLLTGGVLALWAALARAHEIDAAGQVSITPRTLLVFMVALISLVVVHELLHAVSLPGCGLTSATIAGLLFAWMPPWLVLLSAINTFASSGDLIAAALLVWQTPSSATVRNKGIETWWRDAESLANV
jgi:hypothetical protein